MNNTLNDQQVRGYIEELRARLLNLPEAERAEIVQGVEDHIRTELSAEKPVKVVLKELGSPSEVANAANAGRVGFEPRGDSTFYLLSTTFLLLVGGFVFGVGWIFGLFLLWASKSRTLGEKIICTLIWPGGLTAALISLFIPFRSEGRFYPGGVYAGNIETSPWTIAYIVALFAVPILVQVGFLLRALRRNARETQ